MNPETHHRGSQSSSWNAPDAAGPSDLLTASYHHTKWACQDDQASYSWNSKPVAFDLSDIAY